MSTDTLSLRDKARIAFYERKKDAVARAKFLQQAQIFDSKGKLDQKYFPETYAQVTHSSVKPISGSK